MKTKIMEKLKEKLLVCIKNNDTDKAIVSAIMIDKDGDIMAIKFRCIDKDCRCIGSWVRGFENLGEFWFTREEIENM